MLKLGYTYYEKQQYSKAKTVLNELSNNHPETAPAHQANKRLEQMQKEGH